MYNFVANSCIGGWYYNLLGELYNNPFVWTSIDWEYFINLFTGFDKLNYRNIKLDHDENWLFYLTIDGCVRIRHRHHIFDPSATVVTKIDHDIHYCKIWEVIVSNYIKRINRMLSNKFRNIFILEYNDIYKPSYNLLNRFLQYQSPYKLIIFLPQNIFPDYPQYFSDNILIIHDDRVNDGKTANKVFSYAHRNIILPFIST